MGTDAKPKAPKLPMSCCEWWVSLLSMVFWLLIIFFGLLYISHVSQSPMVTPSPAPTPAPAPAVTEKSASKDEGKEAKGKEGKGDEEDEEKEKKKKEKDRRLQDEEDEEEDKDKKKSKSKDEDKDEEEDKPKKSKKKKKEGSAVFNMKWLPCLAQGWLLMFMSAFGVYLSLREMLMEVNHRVALACLEVITFFHYLTTGVLVANGPWSDEEGPDGNLFLTSFGQMMLIIAIALGIVHVGMAIERTKLREKQAKINAALR
mmetsp:Transcript_29401/g.56890  ORF Transcript_29401/g.56890 Transcript_29401/m.56890 type:complete len:259 (-) Transcript_29401:235-1011(-)